MVEREGRQSTREKLLTAAREMVLERFAGDTSPADALSYLTPAAVAERAQVSRGSLYHYWGDDRSTGDRAASTDAATPFRRFLDELAESLWDTSTGLEDLTLVALSLPPNVSDVVLALTAFEVIRRTAGPA
jgi:AcrR family transcriptional regulator